MAPSPENDSTPKAPDKLKQKPTDNNNPDNKGISSEEVTSLDDGQLKALLDEAISYKTPRDKEGKSELFKSLLTDAEDDLRKSTAKSASGSELARYYSTTANQRHQRNKRQPSSISETHGGSLNDLVKEELYQSSNLPHRQLKTVSARQREGGSLPCDVNVGSIYDKEFFLNEFSKLRTNKMDSMETTSLLEDDSISQEFNSIETETVITHAKIPQYITNATLQIGNVDDSVTFPAIERSEKASTVSMDTVEESLKQVQESPHQYSLLSMNSSKWGFNPAMIAEEKKVDENGNAVGNQNSGSGDGKKRKKTGKKVEDFMKAEDVVGHRADIINDIPMLLEFISGSGDKPKGGGGVNKTKLSHKAIADDNNKNKQHKQRTRSSKGSKVSGSHRLQKSTSMEEISTTKMEMDFHFHDGQAQRQESGAGKIPLRTTKSNAERPRERNSWVICAELYQNASAENLENADFTFVTKKKKSKKRRNSLGSRKQSHATEKFGGAEFQRLPNSPHRKSACSVPHSEKSNDSSDADSVHSLPFEESLNNLPVSYADIAAKSAERPKWNRPPSERKKSTSTAEKTTNTSPEKFDSSFQSSPETEQPTSAPPETPNNNNSDLSSLQNWPEIMKYNKVTNSNKQSVVPTTPNNSVKNNAVVVVAATSSPPANNNNENISKIKSVINRTNKTTPPPPTPNVISHTKNNNKIKPPEENLILTPVRENNIFNNQKQQQHIQEKQGGAGVGPMYHQMYQMPPNIRDVQSIEKMQLKNLQGNYQQQHQEVGGASASSLCETEKRPAVVILSGGDKKHVTDITFGFDINEQLLSGDACTDFINRFFLPETPKIVHIDKLVHFIGSEWEDVVVQINSGKVKYYTETYNYSGLI